MKNLSAALHDIYGRLFGRFGTQHWWPGETRDEIIIGAVLTQNTNWSNVEKAIANLKAGDNCTLEAVRNLTHEQLADLIRPSGFFNIKAKRLKALASTVPVIESGDMNRFRTGLLAVDGIGPETADSILCYGYDLPTFVVDAYTRRIFSRLGMISPRATYEEIRHLFMRGHGDETQYYNEYHALIVRSAKEFCRKSPRCEGCPLIDICPTGNGGRA